MGCHMCARSFKNLKDRVYALKILQLSILSFMESISVCARQITYFPSIDKVDEQIREEGS